jgi:hypothetical protein
MSWLIVFANPSRLEGSMFKLTFLLKPSNAILTSAPVPPIMMLFKRPTGMRSLIPDSVVKSKSLLMKDLLMSEIQRQSLAFFSLSSARNPIITPERANDHAFSGSNRTEGALAAFIKACKSGKVPPDSALLVESFRPPESRVSAQSNAVVRWYF